MDDADIAGWIQGLPDDADPEKMDEHMAEWVGPNPHERLAVPEANSKPTSAGDRKLMKKASQLEQVEPKWNVLKANICICLLIMAGAI